MKIAEEKLNSLSPDQKELIQKQQEQLLNFQLKPIDFIEPFDDYDTSGNIDNFKRGKELIAEGLAGCLIIAGGQGTRLKFDGPKGMFPVSKFNKKSLFQLFAEKTFFAGVEAKRKLPLAIMTSKQNYDEINKFFNDNNFFGLDKTQVFFFKQDDLYLLDEEGNPFLDKMGNLAKGPGGNGTALRHFVKSGVFKKFQDMGIKYLNFVLVDNPLADPFDAEFLGFHEKTGADVLIKCCKRLNANELVGTYVMHHNQVKVIEYSEFPKGENIDKYFLINLSLFSFTMDFINKVSSVDLPLHLAHKANSYMNNNGNVVDPSKPNSWKFEEFIFDVLPYAKKVKALLFPREVCFAPLKNATGPDSLESVQKAMQHLDRLIFSKLSGQKLKDEEFELSQEFYYPTPEFIKKWKNMGYKI